MEQIPLDVLVSGLIAFVLELIPPIKSRWDRLNSAQKQAVMIGIVFVITVGSTAYQCFYRGGLCPADFVDYVIALGVQFLINLTVNQGTYRGIKHLPKSERELAE